MSSNVLKSLRWCCGAMLLVVAASTCLRGDSVLVDDGWRRTAQGWELLYGEVVAPQRRIPASSPVVHPLLLAAVQASLVAAAYWRFPVKS
ncbi:MAG: hypothetical protein IAF94_22140 [Pirellulaceae bacterium]|nr:hypothetical protein [Pirellulaceae bacterium]